MIAHRASPWAGLKPEEIRPEKGAAVWPGSTETRGESDGICGVWRRSLAGRGAFAAGVCPHGLPRERSTSGPLRWSRGYCAGREPRPWWLAIAPSNCWCVCLRPQCRGPVREQSRGDPQRVWETLAHESAHVMQHCRRQPIFERTAWAWIFCSPITAHRSCLTRLAITTPVSTSRSRAPVQRLPAKEMNLFPPPLRGSPPQDEQL